MKKKQHIILPIFFSGLLVFTFHSYTFELKTNTPTLQPTKTLKQDHQKSLQTKKTSLKYPIPRQTKKPLQSKGIILAFHQLPSEPEQNKISAKLKKEGLILTKKFKIFKTLVFSWPELKTQNKAQNICKKLSFKNLKYCESNTLLQPNNSNDKQTEASSPAIGCTKNCDHTQNPIFALYSTLKDTEKSCKLLPSKHNLKDGTLTDYWAQEMVGADLLREELEQADPLPEDQFMVAVFDAPAADHHIHVQNIISHKGPQAVLPPLNSSQMQYFETTLSSEYMSAAEKLLPKEENTQNIEISFKKLPSFINNSMRWDSSHSIYESFSKINPPAILVTSSGNFYPAPLSSTKSQFSKDFDGILVGSLSPKGVASHFSQQGEEVHILAPSDDYIGSASSDGSYQTFSGTSGAAPLVTGALAGFEWLSGYHPTSKEAKLLLEKTAIPTPHSEFEEPQQNGVGMLNAYKLGKVAKRLKDKCGNNQGCFKQEINNPENYEFSMDKNLPEQLRSAFPNCSKKKAQNPRPVSCQIKKSTLKKLRQAVLLNIENKALLQRLYCIYEEEGFSHNALFVYRTLAAVMKDITKIPIELSLNENPERVFSLYSKADQKRFVDKLSNDPHPAVRERAVRMAAKLEDHERVRFLEKLSNDPHPAVRERAVREIFFFELGYDEKMKLLDKLSINNPHPDVRERVVMEIFSLAIFKDEEMKFLDKLSNNPHPDVRESMVMEIFSLEHDEGMKLLDKLSNDPHPDVRLKVVQMAPSYLKGNEAKQFLKRFSNDSDLEVRAEAFRAFTQGLRGTAKRRTSREFYKQY